MKTPEEYREIAMKYFTDGMNCSQAVLCTFSDELNIDTHTAQMFASSFGGGMGRLREVCGACTGMFMCAGLKYGYTDENPQDKTAHYTRIQSLAKLYAKRSGGDSIICRELLGLAPKKASLDPDNPQPAARTKEYYKKRPCKELVGEAAMIFAELMQNDGVFPDNV